MNKLGIVIATYQRKDGSTPKYLTRALDSVFNQTYQDFKIFLIGDKYEDEDEIKNLIEKYPKNKLYFENLPFAKERDKYANNKWILWSYGGVNAINYGIDKSMTEGYEYICHLDHDDWWDENHLSLINDCIISTNSPWVCTKSTYYSEENVLPNIISDDELIEFHPKSGQVIHSSVCMNFKKIPFKYRNVYEETGESTIQADGDLWERTKKFLIENNLKSYLINKITCRHDEEGYERK